MSKRISYTLSLALAMVVAFGTTVAMAAQYARPDGTVSATGWTASGTPAHHEATDEVTPNDDTDYVLAADGVAATAELSLTDVTDPQVSSGHIIRFRMMSSGTKGAERCDFILFQGAAEIASLTNQASRDVYTTFEATLTGAEADAITDYSDLRFVISTSTVDTGEQLRVTWMEFEVPDATGASVPTLSSPTVTAVDANIATLGATIDSNGNDPITSRGTVWGTSPEPITNLLAEGGTALGTFSHDRTGLPPATLIYFRGYATNSIGAGYSPDGSFYTEPNVQASGVSFANVSSSGMRITWSAGNGDGTILIVKEGSPVDAGPVDGNEHPASSVFGSGEQLGAGNYVVFRGVGTQADITNLTENTTYYVAAYEYAGSGSGISGINYQQTDPNTASQTTSQASSAVPTLSSPTVTAVDTDAATLGATIDSQGDASITNRGTLWNTSGPPVDQNALDEVGSWAPPVAFSQDRTGLPAGTRIYYRAYATNSFGTGYSPDDSFYTEPATQASGLSFTNVSSSAMRITCTAGSGDGRIIIVKEDSPVDAGPVDGTEHPANAAFGSGAQLGVGNYVVFRGAGNQVNVTNLTGSTTYYVAVYEYAGSGPGASGVNYQQDDPNTATQTTAAAPQGHNASHGIQCVTCHAHNNNGEFVTRNEEQKTKCTTCHRPGGAAENTSDVALHMVNGGSTTVDCGSCHEIHNGQTVIGSNLAWIRQNTGKYVAGALEPALFEVDPNHFAFVTEPWNGICQSCHTTTSHHTNNAFGDHDHKKVGPDAQPDCVSCHTHGGGFEGGSCSSCHGEVQDQDPNDAVPARRAVMGDFSLTSHHVAGGAPTDDDCGVCHYEAVDGAAHKNGLIDLRDPDTGSAITGFVQFSRQRSTDVLESWVTNVQDNFCMKCHDSDASRGSGLGGAAATNFSGDPLQPFSSPSRNAPDVFGSLDAGTAFHHPVRTPGTNSACNATTMVSPWNQDGGGDHDVISCFDCHDTNGHGSANQRALLDPIDFDTMEAAADAASLPPGMGAAVETFCSTCHQASVYVDNTVTGSVFEYHGAAQNQHGAAGGNELGCMGCHAGITNLGDAPKGGGAYYPNGAARGNIHGGDFDWSTTTSFAVGPTDIFMLGGWIGGWQINGSSGECSGGQCNHGGTSRAGKSYTLTID
ncbi:MAG: hypothetical protein JSU94_06190 [Phycisphaerales bacterium]|nr:MAG: hypothetical protein JSU94_06190 [Phycisphaerales bacterium]